MPILRGQLLRGTEYRETRYKTGIDAALIVQNQGYCGIACHLPLLNDPIRIISISPNVEPLYLPEYLLKSLFYIGNFFLLKLQARQIHTNDVVFMLTLLSIWTPLSESRWVTLHVVSEDLAETIRT